MTHKQGVASVCRRSLAWKGVCCALVGLCMCEDASMCAGILACMSRTTNSVTDKAWERNMWPSESDHESIAFTPRHGDRKTITTATAAGPGLSCSAAMFVDVITRAIITHGPAGDSQATPLVSCYARLALPTPLGHVTAPLTTNPRPPPPAQFLSVFVITRLHQYRALTLKGT